MPWELRLKVVKILDSFCLREEVNASPSYDHWHCTDLGNLEKAQSLLERVETAATEVSLHITSNKSKYMVYNLRRQRDNTALDNSKLKQVDDFRYPGAWMSQTEIDVGMRKAKAWAASNKLTEV